jgi:hypothetical protein
MKDKFDIYNDSNILEKKCNTCGKNDHYVINCPLLNFRKSRELIIKTYLENKKNQIRRNFNRPNKKRRFKPQFLQFQGISQKFYQENEQKCLNFLNFRKNSNIIKKALLF